MKTKLAVLGLSALLMSGSATPSSVLQICLPQNIIIDSDDPQTFELLAITQGDPNIFHRADLKWSSSAPEIADFVDGQLIGYTNGTAVLTCTSVPYNLETQSVVFVRFPEPEPKTEPVPVSEPEPAEESESETENTELEEESKEPVYSFYGYDETVNVGYQGRITAYVNNEPVQGSTDIQYVCTQTDLITVEPDGSFTALQPGVAYVYLTDWEGHECCAIITIVP